MSQFPNIVDEAPATLQPVAVESVGSRRGRNDSRVIIDCPGRLKRRLNTLSFETGMSVAEIGRFALWTVVLEGEANHQRFCHRVAGAKLNHLKQERP